MVDWMPGLSQAKSAVQAIFGDCEGARRTQENFSRQCPVVSQIRSAVELISGDEKAAKQTQYECGRIINGFIDATPLVGHVKGVLHYAVGDKEGGDNAMKSACRTVGVMAGGVGGFITAGPPGAYVGGIVGGGTVDCAITAVDSSIHGVDRSYGYARELKDLIENPYDPGKWFDTVAMLAGDGSSGYSSGKAYNSMKNCKDKRAARKQYEAQKKRLTKKVGEQAANDFIEAADRMTKARKKYVIPKSKRHVTTVVRDLKNNKLFEGHNKQVRNFCRNQKHAKAESMCNYSNPEQPTNLQRKVPNAEPPMKRNPNTCAEQYAYHKYYKENPNGNPKYTRGASVRYDNQTNITRVVKRCDNCMAYDKGMGYFPGDMIDGEPVPNHPGVGKFSHHKDAVQGMAMAGVSVAFQINAKRKKRE